MKGVKVTGKSEKSLIEALSEQIGYKKSDEPELAKYDASTGTYLCATLDIVPDQLLEEARDYYEAENTVLRAQAESSAIKSSSLLFTKKATYARLAAQALEKEIKSR